MKKIITFGEIMLRLATKVGERLTNTHSLDMHYGGGEANVAISLANFGHSVYFISKVPNNLLGLGVKSHLKFHDVSTEYIIDGGERLGTYYLESGIGQRSPKVIYDRKYSSFSSLEGHELDLEKIFDNASLFHVSGITLALSSSLRDLTLELLKKAKDLGVLTSFDFNYRSSLWGHKEASEAIKTILPYIDVCSCGELDAIYLLDIEQCNKKISKEEKLIYYYRKIKKLYPYIKCMFSTFREVSSASENILQGNIYINDQLHQSREYCITSIVDRVGGGDAFCSGILHGFLCSKPPKEIVSFAIASAVLKHTISGDCNLFSISEIENFMGSDSGKILR